MKNTIQPLQHCPLFKDVDSAELSRIIAEQNYSLHEYPRDGIIAVEDEQCSSLGLVLEGRVDIQKVYSTGKTVTMAQLGPGQMFGEAIVFSKSHTYPATIKAAERAKIISLKRETIVALCSSHPAILKNFMELLSDRILMLNKKIKELSYETIRQKVASYLLTEYQIQKSLSLLLPLSKQELADMLGIQRPSLSRELINMQKDALLEMQKNRIKIIDLPALEDLTL